MGHRVADRAEQVDFVPTKRILCQPSGFCADQVDFVPTKWILCQPSGFCADQVDFVLNKWKLYCAVNANCANQMDFECQPNEF